MVLKLAFANVRRSYKDFAVYFVTLLAGVAVYYAFNSVTAQQAVLDLSEAQGKMIDLLSMLIDGVSVFIAIILAFLVVYASRFFVRRRNKEFGLYLLLGMSRGTLLRLMCAETLIVGALSLVVGLLLGVVLSQILVGVTAWLFVADMSQGFTFLFAADCAFKTIAVFAVIFVCALVFDVGYLMKARLITLLHSDRKNDTLTLRSIPLSCVLFIVACVCIAMAYHLLLENGLTEFDTEFLASTALVCVGTLLFFYSLSGFLVRLVQMIKSLYYRGLNMFTLRQIASRINSSFASMAIICMTLFLAITSVCGGISICNALQGSYEEQTHYDASLRTYHDVMGIYGEDGAQKAQDALDRYDGDMEEGLRQSAVKTESTQWDSMVRESGEVDLYTSDVTYKDIDELSSLKLSDTTSMVNPGEYDDYAVPVIKLSQFNRARAMAGMEEITLASDEVLLNADMDAVRSWLENAASSGGTLRVYDTDLKVVDHLDTTCLETTSVFMETGVLIVNDDVVPQDADVSISILNVQLVDGGAYEPFLDTIGTIQESDRDGIWPVSMVQTRQEIYDQGVGLTTIVSYLAIYIGFVLVVACAAILAIQQLTSASDNRRRYELLNKLGASRRELNGSLLKQVVIAFVFPLVLAVCHSICALVVVVDVVRIFGAIDIAEMAVIATMAFLVVYCAYFLLTYFQARRIIHSGESEVLRS